MERERLSKMVHGLQHPLEFVAFALHGFGRIHCRDLLEGSTRLAMAAFSSSIPTDLLPTVGTIFTPSSADNFCTSITRPWCVGNVDHVEGDDDGKVVVDDLTDEIQVPLEVACVNDADHEFGKGSVIDAAKEDIRSDFFIRGISGKAVGAREVEQHGFTSVARTQSFLLFFQPLRPGNFQPSAAIRSAR